MKIILVTTSTFDCENNYAIHKLIEAGYTVELNPFGRRLNENELHQLIARRPVVGMIAGVEPITNAIIKEAPLLKVISRCGIGVDNVDLMAASQAGIKVRNTPNAPVSAVAELTLGLILNMLRRIKQSDRDICLGQWRPQMGSLLCCQKVGIVGFGKIGRAVADMLSAFGAKIFICDPMVREVPEYAHHCDLDDLLEQSDIVSLHVPYNRDTHHLIGANQIKKMKEGSFIVNTARGGLLDEAALAEALTNNHLAGAALDVFENEPYFGDLINQQNILLSAHMGSYAKESRIQMEREAAENLCHELLTSAD